MSIITDSFDAHATRTARSFPGLGALQQAAQRIADLRRSDAPFKTMDLVNVLLCQAARSRRVAQPAVRLRLNSDPRNGVVAVRLKLS
jgi:hypothetical protein